MAKKEVYAEEEAQRILPLLVSIGREIKNRAREIDEAETRMGPVSYTHLTLPTKA